MREVQILDNLLPNDKINLHLRRGEIHALLGKQTGWKSTDEYVGRIA